MICVRCCGLIRRNVAGARAGLRDLAIPGAVRVVSRKTKKDFDLGAATFRVEASASLACLSFAGPVI
jgi:hypothetical protein